MGGAAVHAGGWPWGVVLIGHSQLNASLQWMILRAGASGGRSARQFLSLRKAHPSAYIKTATRLTAACSTIAG
jgi:hypothetical protein